MLRTCVYCNQDKPYDPNAKRESVAMGFVGYACLPCHRLKIKLARHKLDITDPNAATQYAELKAQKAKFKVHKPAFEAVSKPYHELVSEAQSTLIAFDCAYPVPDGPQVAQRFALAYALKLAQHKVALFGPDAFDIKSIKKAKSDVD